MKCGLRNAGIWIALALLGLLAIPGVAWWEAWTQRGPLEPSGGLWWPVRQELEVPHFLQGDRRWGLEPLAKTSATLGQEGCAVASAAMVLAARGVDTDPGRLNAFLNTVPEGFTPQGWIYWEKAPLKNPALTSSLLPHYEDTGSFALIDQNLLRGNPVIARLRYASGTTHFVVIVGKQGFDYLILDPGADGKRGVYSLKEFGSGIEAIRFFRPEK